MSKLAFRVRTKYLSISRENTSFFALLFDNRCIFTVFNSVRTEYIGFSIRSAMKFIQGGQLIGGYDFGNNKGVYFAYT